MSFASKIVVSLSLGLLATTAANASQITLNMVPVGNPGNAPDPATGSLYGSVGYNYNIDANDVTLGQYTAFLNAVAQSDTYGVYNIYMQGGKAGFPFGIAQADSPGSYSYSVTGANSQAVNMPAFSQSWGDAARFVNWLDNGQPTGAEGNGTTETGAYQLSGATSQTALMSVAAPAHTGAGAPTYFLPTEDEWYKAAFYSPLLNSGSGGYWTYATQSNLPPDNSLVLATSDTNDANYFTGNYTDPTNYLTPVGTFAASSSYYHTFDQDGDVFQWNETEVTGSTRGLRGGNWISYNGMDSSYRSSDNPANQTSNSRYDFGFRVAGAVVPEPGSLALVISCGAVLGSLRRRRTENAPRSATPAITRIAAATLNFP